MDLMFIQNNKICHYGSYTRIAPTSLLPYSHSWQIKIAEIEICLYAADSAAIFKDESFRLDYRDTKGEFYYIYSAENNTLTYYGERDFNEFQEQLKKILSVYDKADMYVDKLVATIIEQSDTGCIMSADEVKELPGPIKSLKQLMYIIEHNRQFYRFCQQNWQEEGKSVFLSVEDSGLVLNCLPGQMVGNTMYQPLKRITNCINSIDITREIKTLSIIYSIIPFNRSTTETFSVLLNLQNCELEYTNADVPDNGYVCIYSETVEPSPMTTNLSSREQIERYEMRDVYLKQIVIPNWSRQALVKQVERIMHQN